LYIRCYYFQKVCCLDICFCRIYCLCHFPMLLLIFKYYCICYFPHHRFFIEILRDLHHQFTKSIFFIIFNNNNNWRFNTIFNIIYINYFNCVNTIILFITITIRYLTYIHYLTFIQDKSHLSKTSPFTFHIFIFVIPMLFIINLRNYISFFNFQ